MAIESPVLDKRFQLGKVLGRGPSGVVHFAKDLSQGGDCVVKRIYAKFGSRNVLDKVQTVAHAAADMMHPAVLGVLYTGYEPSGTLYLVSPLSSGETLRARILRGPLPVSLLLALLDPLCSALQAAADRGLSHGSLTPTNIFLTPDDGLQLGDFGMAELRNTPGVRWEGPLGYVAPETLDTGAERTNARADVFSLGALIYECLIGQPMFDAKSLAPYLAMVGSPPKMTVRNPLYGHLDSVLEMAAAADPEARFATVWALWRALQSALLDLPANLANNLTRGRAPVSQRGQSAPPKPPAEGSNPVSLRNVQEMPLVPGEPGDSGPEPTRPKNEQPPAQGIRAPGPPRLLPGPKAPPPVSSPEPLPPPPNQKNASVMSVAAAPILGPTAPMPMVSAAPAPPGPVDPSSVSAPKSAQPPKGVRRAMVGLPAVVAQPVSAEQPKVNRAPTDLAAPRAPRRSDPQQLLLTDPSYRLRLPKNDKSAAFAPLFWATLGGVVVGSAMLGVQYYGRLAQQRHFLAPHADAAAFLRQAETESWQHNYDLAQAYAELALRADRQHPKGKQVFEQAAEQLRISAVYGAFLNAADRDQDDLAVALYRELPPGSPFRSQAWDPFMKVRNKFVRRRLAVATAALGAGDCETIHEQIERLYFIADSATDSALQQGQRLLGKCKGHRIPESPTDDKAPTGAASQSTQGEKTDKTEKIEKTTVAETPDSEVGDTSRRRRKRNKGEKADKTTEKAQAETKTDTQSEPKENLPSSLRNPF